MVYITHSGENVDKINHILKVAQKRFGLYGLEKTAMREIATDLGISKASLYYYFPDKESLFKAVVEMEQNEFFRVVEDIYAKTDDPRTMLNQYNQIRMKYFKTLFNLSRLRLQEFHNMKPMLGDILGEFHCREIDLIQRIINSGKEKEIFGDDDTLEMSTLFIEVIKGLRMQVMHKSELLYIDETEYENLEKKLSLFTDIFIRGLSCKKENNNSCPLA